MSFFQSLFGNSTSAATPAPAPAPAATPEQAAVNANPTVPNPTNTPHLVDPNNPGAQVKSPLDNFADLWKNDPKQQQQQPTGFGPIDPKTFADAAQKLDFSQIIKPENLAAISQGGEAATRAFAESMNGVAQAVYAQSAHATTQLIDSALAKAEASFAAKIPTLIKSHNLTNGLTTENPALSHPAAAPILGALQQQLTLKYPNATEAELKSMAGDYLKNFASLVTPAPTTPQSKAETGTDWDAYFKL